MGVKVGTRPSLIFALISEKKWNEGGPKSNLSKVAPAAPVSRGVLIRGRHSAGREKRNLDGRTKRKKRILLEPKTPDLIRTRASDAVDGHDGQYRSLVGICLNLELRDVWRARNPFFEKGKLKQFLEC